MKILVVSRNAWDETNAIGNTLANFFSGVKNAEFASLYFRASMPNNRICSLYYRFSEKEILKNWFSPKKIGEKFEKYFNEYKCDNDTGGEKEKALIHFIHKYDIGIAYKLSDFLWYSQKWLNTGFDNFIKEFSPDVIFTFAKSSPQYYLSIKYLREKYNIPVITWIADDEYTALLKKGRKNDIAHLKYILNESAVVRGCSSEICEYYNSIFDCKATPLYKGCVFSKTEPRNNNRNLKLVYAGNLLYGRMETICRIGKALSIKKNFEDKRPEFEIYSNTFLNDDDVRRSFSDIESIKYQGKRDYDTIRKKLACSDITVYVESFEEQQKLKTKFSFSTKIIDYLQCGKPILAVGPKDIASINYLKHVPGVVVIDNLDELEANMLSFLEDTCAICDASSKIRQYAEQYHSSAVVAKDMTEMLEYVVSRKNM